MLKLIFYPASANSVFDHEKNSDRRADRHGGGFN